MSTKTTKKILSPTNNRISKSSTTTTTTTTRQRISNNNNNNNNNYSGIETRSKSRLRDNQFFENEEFEDQLIYQQQQEEIVKLRDNQLYELEELEEQQLNEIEQLTNQQQQIQQQQQQLSNNNRLKNLFKVLVTILVFSIIYGVYTNQFQPKPVEPFHATQPIGHSWMENIIDKSNHWLQLWKNSYKELTRVLPLPESETLPAGHYHHHHHHQHDQFQQPSQDSTLEKKRIQQEMEKMRDLDYNNYKLKQQQHQQQFKTTNNDQDNVIEKKRNGPPLYTLDERIKKEIERQLKPHPAQYPPKDPNRQLENEKLQNQHQHLHPINQENGLPEKLQNFEESIKDNLEQAVYKIEEKSKELLHNIEEKKDQIKSIMNNEQENPIQKEIDQLISSIENANYKILDNIKDKITDPTIENLNQLKYKFNDASRESREQFKYQYEKLKEKGSEFIENEKNKFGPNPLNVKPIC